MLIPITRQTFEELIPAIATGPQYRYCWGKFPEFLRRLLISVVALVLVYFLGAWLGQGFDSTIGLLIDIIAGLYWFWAPVYWASMRNLKIRRYPYSGFWHGRVSDVFVTEELVDTQETVNKQGELVIVENRERRINVEVEDETGFTTLLQAPLQRLHKGITPGQSAQMVVMSDRPDLAQITMTSDIYLPRMNLWVSDYPYLRRDVFMQVSRRLSPTAKARPQPRERIVKVKRRRRF